MPPSLVYLPGLDGTGRLLHRQPRLHEAFDVRCVTYPHTPLAGYEDLADLAIARLSDGPGIVLAESFGGAVALTLALRRPDLVSRLVLVNTFAQFPSRLLIRTAAALGRFLPARPSNPATRGLRGIFFFAPDIPPPERAAWWERTCDVPMSAFGWRLRLLADLDLRNRLCEVQIPTLVLVAPNDRVVPPRAGHLLAQKLPRCHKIELPVGHAALIHPLVDVAALLDNPAYWPAVSAASTAVDGPA